MLQMGERGRMQFRAKTLGCDDRISRYLKWNDMKFVYSAEILRDVTSPNDDQFKNHSNISS